MSINMRWRQTYDDTFNSRFCNKCVIARGLTPDAYFMVSSLQISPIWQQFHIHMCLRIFNYLLAILTILRHL